LKNAGSPLTSLLGSLISVGFAVSGALGAFSILQKSLNVIWEVKPIIRGRIDSIREEAVPFLLIIGLSLGVVAMTTVSTVLFNAIILVLAPFLDGLTQLFLRSFEILLSLGLGTLLFAIIFKLVPQTTVRWQDVWLAAGVTALVFTILNYLFGVYLSLFKVTTLAGTAGSLMVLFLWIYILNLFVLFGAQFSKVYADTHGSLPMERELENREEENEREKLDIRSEIKIKLRERGES